MIWNKIRPVGDFKYIRRTAIGSSPIVIHTHAPWTSLDPEFRNRYNRIHRRICVHRKFTVKNYNIRIRRQILSAENHWKEFGTAENVNPMLNSFCIL